MRSDRVNMLGTWKKALCLIQQQHSVLAQIQLEEMLENSRQLAGTGLQNHGAYALRASSLMLWKSLQSSFKQWGTCSVGGPVGSSHWGVGVLETVGVCGTGAVVVETSKGFELNMLKNQFILVALSRVPLTPHLLISFIPIHTSLFPHSSSMESDIFKKTKLEQWTVMSLIFPAVCSLTLIVWIVFHIFQKIWNIK